MIAVMSSFESFDDYQDFSFIDDEEAFRELCSTFEFDVYDDSITSSDILRRKRELDSCSGQFSRRAQTDDELGGSDESVTSSQDRRGGRKSGSKALKCSLPSDDIRRRYAQIFSDGFNSQGKAELQQLLEAHCTPDCWAVYKYQGNPNPVYGPQYCELIGQEAILNYWTAIFCAVPDSVFEVQESKLRALPNGSCAVIMKFIFSGTKIFKISADNHPSVVYAQSERAPVLPPSKGKTSSDSVEESLRSTAIDQPVDTLKIDGYLERSQPMTLLGTMTFYTHADRKIHKIDVIYCVRL